MVVASSNSEEIIRRVDCVAEIVIVHLIHVSFVHKCLQEYVHDILWRTDSQNFESSQELVLGDVLVPCDVEILEHWLEMDPLDSNSLLILVDDSLKHVLLLLVELEVLSASWHRVLVCNWSHSHQRLLLDAVGSKSTVDARAELFVVDHELRIGRFVFRTQEVELLLGQVEVEAGKNTFKLGFGHLSFAKFVEIEEELLYSHSLHHDGSLKSRLNIRWVVCNLNSLVKEPVVDHVHVFGSCLVVRGSCVSQLSFLNAVIWLRSFGNVFWENVFRSIDIGTKSEVVHLPHVSFVKVLPEQKLEGFFVRWNEM